MQRTQPWFIGAALRALALNVTNTRRVFTRSELIAWDMALAERPGLAKMALGRMAYHQLVELQPDRPVAQDLTRVDQRWRLTDKGLATCRSVAQALPGAPPPDPSALSTRLWNLLRSRRTLTAEEAASTLIDAGERDFAKAQHQLGDYLSIWAKLVPKHVQVSAQRIGNAKRYVMVTDGGLYPPPTKVRRIRPVPAPAARPVPPLAKRAKATDE